jgi:hypothetical protein
MPSMPGAAPITAATAVTDAVRRSSGEDVPRSASDAIAHAKALIWSLE